MADKKITQMTAADVADLGALTSFFEVTVDALVTPLTRKIGLGKIATWLATIGLAASNVLAQGVTVTQGTITDPVAGYVQTVTWNDVADTFIAQTLDVTDTASAAGSLLARYRVGGVTQFSVSKAGAGVFAGALSFTGGTFTTSLASTTALATPGALGATAFNAFASTVSGATLMGFGTTADVTLKNRAGTDVLTIGPNTTAAVFDGAVTSTGNLTVGASTFVVTAATGAVSAAGLITSTLTTGKLFTADAATTGSIYQRFSNTAGSVVVGLESSTGSSIITGTSAYAVVIGTDLSKSVQICTNNAPNLTILSGGAATFSSSLAVTGALTGVTTAALSQYIEGTEMAAPAAPAANKGRIFFQDNGAGKTQLMCIFASGAAQQLAIEP